MPRAFVFFESIDVAVQVIDSQQGSFMISSVNLRLEFPDRTIPGVSVRVKQTVGTDSYDPVIEVESPSTRLGRFNYNDFQKCVEAYYLRCIGPEGQLLRIDARARQIEVQNSHFGLNWMCSFDVSEGSAGAW